MEIVLLIAGFLIYFIPSFVGAHKRNAGAIVTLNIFLGWTVIGWIVALVWAATNDKEDTVIVQSTLQNQNSVDQLEKLSKLRSEGILTHEEFTIEKQKILSGK